MTEYIIPSGSVTDYLSYCAAANGSFCFLYIRDVFCRRFKRLTQIQTESNVAKLLEQCTVNGISVNPENVTRKLDMIENRIQKQFTLIQDQCRYLAFTWVLLCTLAIIFNGYPYIKNGGPLLLLFLCPPVIYIFSLSLCYGLGYYCVRKEIKKVKTIRNASALVAEFNTTIEKTTSIIENSSSSS